MGQATVHDVAAQILLNLESSTSTMKLQKLTFLSQGWSLGLRGKPLFNEDFEAWLKGPVCRDLFQYHKGQYNVANWPHNGADPNRLDPISQMVISAVVRKYGALTGVELSQITHQVGSPWDLTRQQQNVSVTGYSNTVISKEVIKDYYAATLTGSRK